MEDMQAMTLRLPGDVYDRLRRLAFDHRVPITELVREAVDDYLAKKADDHGLPDG